MRPFAVLLILGLWLLAVNVLLYFHEPVQRWYLPVWGRVPTLAGWAVLGAWLLLCGVLLRPRFRNRRVRPGVTAVAFLLVSVTWVQVAIGRNDYRTLLLANDIVLLNFTGFGAESAPVRRILDEVEQERRALATLFGMEPEGFRIALFPSRGAMHRALGPGFGEPAARTQFLTRTIYISLADWNTSFRHELVHLFQGEWARRSPSRWTRFLFRHNECLTESLAYYLAPESGGVSARPVDYINALDLTHAEWDTVGRFERVAPTGHPLNPEIQRSVDIFLCTYPWQVAGSDAQAVRLYQQVTTDESVPLPRTVSLPVGSRDPDAEALLGYALAPHFRIRTDPDPRLRTVAAFAGERGRSINQRRALAEWNAANTPSLPQRVAWEVVLDTLGTGRTASPANTLHARARDLAEGEIRDQASLASTLDGLRAVLRESTAAGYQSVAAYTYWRLLDLESMSGQLVPTAPSPGIEREFNRYLAEYMAWVRARFPTQSRGG